jgi:hypothetical protein
MSSSDKFIIEVEKNSLQLFIKIINDEFEDIVNRAQAIKLYADANGNRNFEITFPNMRHLLSNKIYLYQFYRIGITASELSRRYGFKISWEK